MSSDSARDERYYSLRHLLITWYKLRKLPRKQIDDEALQGLGFLTSRINIDIDIDEEEDEDKTGDPLSSQGLFFNPFPAREFRSLPAYDIDNEFPREGGDCLENAGYGRSMGRAADTLWLLAHVWENLAPAAPAASPHVIGSLINDIAIHAGGGGGGGEGEGKEDRLVPSELLVLTQLIMATMNMKRWVEHTVFPVLLISILGKQQARIIQGHFDGKNVIVRYSKLYDFSEEKNAPTTLFLRWFMCSAVGNTRA